MEVRFQHRKELQFLWTCARCGQFVRYAAVKCPEDLKEQLRCDNCKASEDMEKRKEKAAQTKAFKKAQIKMPWATK